MVHHWVEKTESQTKEVTSEAWEKGRGGPFFSAVYDHQIGLTATRPHKQKRNWDVPMKYSKVSFEFTSSNNPSSVIRKKQAGLQAWSSLWKMVLWIRGIGKCPFGFHQPQRNLAAIATTGHKDSDIFYWTKIYSTSFKLSPLILFPNCNPELELFTCLFV